MRTALAALLVAFIVSPLVSGEVLRIVVEASDGSKTVFVPEAAPVRKKSNIGINLADVRYYSTERPWTNLARQASTWQWSRTSGGWANATPGPVDANGYPMAVPPGTFAGLVLDMHQGNANGQYSYLPASVAVDGATAPGVFSKTRDNQRIIARVTAGIQSLSIHEATADPNEFWYPPFVERCKRFGCLRFMNWASVNDARQVSWETRVTPGWYTQGDREVAYELQLQLMEKCASDGWLCVHHTASDGYVRSLAKLAKQYVPAGHMLYVEHSNEVWNWIFPQARYCADRSPVTGSPLEYHIRRTAEIAKIFREEGVEVVSVLGAQSVAAGHFEWVLSRIGPLPIEIDAIAIAPYFGHSITAEAKASGIDAVLAQCEAEIDKNRADVAQWRALCERFQLRLLAYEGGQHLQPTWQEQSNQAIVDLYIAANRHPRMGALYRKYLAAWDQDTNQALMCLFNSVYPPGKHGSWGLLEYENQPTATAPKWTATMEHMGLAP